jgi:hypothetical protein
MQMTTGENLKEIKKREDCKDSLTQNTVLIQKIVMIYII